MDVFETIAARRSVREFSPKPVEQEKLDRVLDAARLAPSARNEQNWRFIVVRDGEKKLGLCEAAFNQPYVKDAPCVIVACGISPRVMDCGQPTDTVNLSIAMAFIALEARELGLGTCWLGHFEADKVKSILNIPGDVSVITMMPLGYPADWPEARPRKSAGEIVGYDTY